MECPGLLFLISTHFIPLPRLLMRVKQRNSAWRDYFAEKARLSQEKKP
jgi:hypothetical protein